MRRAGLLMHHRVAEPVVDDLSGSVDGEAGSDCRAVRELDLCPHAVAAGNVEPDVQAELGTESGAGDSEDGSALTVGGFGVPVSEGASVGAHHHDVSGGAE